MQSPKFSLPRMQQGLVWNNFKETDKLVHHCVHGRLEASYSVANYRAGLKLAELKTAAGYRVHSVQHWNIMHLRLQLAVLGTTCRLTFRAAASVDCFRRKLKISYLM